MSSRNDPLFSCVVTRLQCIHLHFQCNTANYKHRSIHKCHDSQCIRETKSIGPQEIWVVMGRARPQLTPQLFKTSGPQEQKQTVYKGRDFRPLFGIRDRSLHKLHLITDTKVGHQVTHRKFPNPGIIANNVIVHLINKFMQYMRRFCS